MSLKVNIEKRQGEVYVFSISGSIDSDTYRLVEDKVNPIFNAGAKVIIFDLDKVEYVSSMGLNMMFGVQRNMEKTGGTFLMINVQPQVRKVFEIVKALPDMKIFESIEEADAYLYKIQRDELEKGDAPS